MLLAILIFSAAFAAASVYGVSRVRHELYLPAIDVELGIKPTYHATLMAADTACWPRLCYWEVAVTLLNRGSRPEYVRSLRLEDEDRTTGVDLTKSVCQNGSLELLPGRPFVIGVDESHLPGGGLIAVAEVGSWGEYVSPVAHRFEELLAELAG